MARRPTSSAKETATRLEIRPRAICPMVRPGQPISFKPAGAAPGRPGAALSRLAVQAFLRLPDQLIDHCLEAAGALVGRQLTVGAGALRQDAGGVRDVVTAPQLVEH